MSNSMLPVCEPMEAKLPRRDWILLPLIAFATVAFIFGATELAARFFWRQSEKDPCLVKDGPTGAHFRSNCRSNVKAAEGPWVENVYNNCGYRTLEPCGPAPPGTVRVAVLGGSVSYGYLVPYNSTYPALASQALTRACHRHVEFQNVGAPGATLNDTYLRTKEALALKPNLLLLVMDPFDVARLTQFDPNAVRADSGSGEGEKNIHDWVRTYIVLPLKSSRAAMVLLHFMYQNPSTYATLFLKQGDNAGYLKPSFSPPWQGRFSNLDTMLRSISSEAKTASVPMALLIWPSPAQVALINSPPRPEVQTDAFQQEVTKIAARYKIQVINSLTEFEGRRDAMKMFYIVDSHPNAQAERIVAYAVTKALLSGEQPAFAGCSLQ